MLENFRLKVFRAVAEHLSFRKAGEQLYLTQPAVTLQIKALEEELGTKLFERSAAGVSLSDAGRVLVGYAERLRELAAQAENELAGMKGQAAGSLVLGASTTIAQYVIPAHLAAFSRRFPGVQLQVFGENTEKIAEGVASGRFGLGLIEGPALRKDLLVEDWFEDEIFVTVPAGHEWADLGMIAPEKLLEEALVIRERGSGSRHVVEQALQKAGLRLGSLRVAMELDSTEAILSCVEEGLGVGFVSKWAMERRVGAHSLAVLRIDGHRMMRQFSFVLPRGPEAQPMAVTFKRFLQAARAQ
jgi:LysR family transcriptional regulator, transcriptional activator of the cysJI operon